MRRYVATRAIRDAVKGREGEVLDALGIPWRDGRPHVCCPYPDHDDRHPSWHWDVKHDRAYCTCISRSHSIFDVAAKMRGFDFEAAKVLVAELLGRDELIRISDDAAGQRTDPDSLLSPPATLSDDGLVARYLAARLDLADAAAVLLPSTKAVGWTALGYFDPPPKKGEPKLIASPPSAVFETVAADGRRHAHRLYLAADGSGKAELGVDSNGKARDPKKSARVAAGAPSTAGCCVAWGNPDVPDVVVAEGIETAAAIAHAFAAEIERGEVAVLSAISAVGVEAFQPWPNNRRVTIAADRDEGKPGRGFKRGERAARNLGLRLCAGHSGVAVAIALPGMPGASIDFCDLLLSDGGEAVRTAILAAASFQPTPEETEEFNTHAARQTELERINQLYTLPALIGMRVEYRHTESNRIWLHKLVANKIDQDTGERQQVWEPVSSPFGNLALISTLGSQPAYGLRVHIQTLEGASSAVDILRADLPKLGASGIRSELMQSGLRVANGGELTIVEILKQAEPETCIGATTAVGWQATNDEFFLLFGGEQW